MQINSGTIVRTVILVLALTNQVLAVFGKSPLNIADDEVAALVSAMFTVYASVAAWWKNNSFTSTAIKADEYLSELRS